MGLLDWQLLPLVVSTCRCQGVLCEFEQQNQVMGGSCT